MAFLLSLYSRALQSYEETVLQYQSRVEHGTQPSTPIINLFDMHQQEMVLIMGNVGYLITTAVLYRIMSRRKPFQLKRVLTLYNLINVLISGYISLAIIRYKVIKHSRFICNRGEEGLAYVFVLFYVQKFWEFCDTYFFVLRKSFRQVTFLHLFHHASITVIVGTLLPFDFDGDMYLPILVNSIVHVLVYLHYFVTCIGYTSWWSPYLTSLQMGQFAFIFTQSILAFLEGPTCGSPDFSKILMIAYMGSMLVLFSDFFVKRYILHQQAYDMCGVIKSVEYAGGPICSTFHGNAKMSAQGTAMVRMPKHFSEGITNVEYCYQLTALNEPMPDLHISQAMTRATTKQGVAYYFIVGGGRPQGTISWMVCMMRGDDKVRMH